MYNALELLVKAIWETLTPFLPKTENQQDDIRLNEFQQALENINKEIKKRKRTTQA